MSKYCNHCMASLEADGAKCPVCGKDNTGTVPAHHLLPGTMLNGKFYVGEALGEGGFGITYIGRDTKLDMKVAIKEFYPNGYVNRSNTTSARVNDSVTENRRDFFEKGRERFLKEAQILAKFSGEPGVVDVRDFFEENNTAYIIMEYLDGIDLKTYLKKHGTLTPEHTIHLLMPVMNSLKKVHAKGLIHRDISPDNIMVVGDKVKLLDFGAARSVSAEANKSLSVMLKPGYAPEEQYRSKGNQGPWTDIYALCATMYKCITGVTPDDATQRVFSDEVKTPSAINVAIKPEIERAIMRGMSVHQADRYQCIEDLIRGLQGIDVAISGTDYTVAAGRNVVEDNQETVFVPAAADDRTVLQGEPATVYAGAAEKTTHTATVAPQAKTQAPVVAKTVEKPQEAPKKSKGKLNIILMIVAILVAVIPTAIIFIISGGESVDDESKKSKKTQSTSDEVFEEYPEDEYPEDEYPEDEYPEDEEIVMSDNLFDFTFILDGKVYALPCAYEDFTNNGWTISSTGYNSNTKIDANNYDFFNMSKDGYKITVYAVNLSGNTKAVKDCAIGGIECSAYNGPNFEIAKGITVTSTKEEIKAAFGIPGESYKSDSYEEITYYATKDSYSNCVEFTIKTEAKYSYICLKNFVETQEDQTTTNTEKPAYLSQYKAPTAMGTDLTSAVVKIEGQLYQLPAPVSAFLDNGWEITEQSGDVVAGGRDDIQLEKNGKQMTLYIYNFGDYQTTVENCAVYKVDVDGFYDKGTPSVVIGSAEQPITIGSGLDAVLNLVTDSFYVSEGDSYCSFGYYEYGDREFDVYIYVDLETETVMSIKVSCETWGY